MVRVAVAVQVDVPWVRRVLLFELGLDGRRVRRLRQDLLEEVDVARVVHLVEFPRHGVVQDHHPAGAHQRLAHVHVEEVAQPQALHEDRVHDRVDVVGADVGEPHHHHVRLAVHLHQLLAVHRREGLLVHGLGLAGVNPGDAVRRLDPSEHLAADS